MHAGHCTLKRAQAQLALTLQVEARPEPGEAFCQCCADIGQYAHLFTFALHEGIELSCQLVVDLLFVLNLPAKVRNIFEFFPKRKEEKIIFLPMLLHKSRNVSTFASKLPII
jgi:hypothetical protein